MLTDQEHPRGRIPLYGNKRNSLRSPLGREEEETRQRRRSHHRRSQRLRRRRRRLHRQSPHKHHPHPSHPHAPRARQPPRRAASGSNGLLRCQARDTRSSRIRPQRLHHGIKPMGTTHHPRPLDMESIHRLAHPLRTLDAQHLRHLTRAHEQRKPPHTHPSGTEHPPQLRLLPCQGRLPHRRYQAPPQAESLLPDTPRRALPLRHNQLSRLHWCSRLHHTPHHATATPSRRSPLQSQQPQRRTRTHRQAPPQQRLLLLSQRLHHLQGRHPAAPPYSPATSPPHARDARLCPTPLPHRAHQHHRLQIR